VQKYKCLEEISENLLDFGKNNGLETNTGKGINVNVSSPKCGAKSQYEED
jgi:hypothetical protein